LRKLLLVGLFQVLEKILDRILEQEKARFARP